MKPKPKSNPPAAKPAAPAPPPLVPVKKAVPKGMRHDKDLLLSVFAIQNPSRNKACNDHAMRVIESLAPKGCTVVRNGGNMLIRKGPAKGPHPYYLAHMDQVHDYVPFMQVHVNGNVLHAIDGNDDQTGVGGDDKCGIYLALRMLHMLPHCTAVFVRDEEIGCLGSGKVPLAWFAHAAFVIQADRNNRTMDVIRDTNGMECASDEFIDAILGLPICCAAGHKENSGSITDIGELASRGLAVSMINVSSGYHNPHTHREIVHLDELSVALQLAYEAASLLGDTCWAHTPTSNWYAPSSYKGKGSGSYYGENGYEPSQFERDYLSPSGKGTGEFLTAAEAKAQAYLKDDAVYKEELITVLVHEFDFDRDFECLDSCSIELLEEWVDDMRASERAAAAELRAEEDALRGNVT